MYNMVEGLKERIARYNVDIDAISMIVPVLIMIGGFSSLALSDVILFARELLLELSGVWFFLGVRVPSKGLRSCWSRRSRLEVLKFCFSWLSPD